MNEATRHVTRFIGLGKVGNPEKKKWLYAFNVVPIPKMDRKELTIQPSDVTEVPFKPVHLHVEEVITVEYFSRWLGIFMELSRVFQTAKSFPNSFLTNQNYQNHVKSAQ